jgi:CRISPR-associated protein Cas2
MKDEHFVVVVYDISNDRRRTRLHKKLKDFGDPVQYSVFECALSTKQICEMKKIVKKVIKPRMDHIRYYYLCASCAQKIEVIGRKDVIGEPEVLVA